MIGGRECWYGMRDWMRGRHTYIHMYKCVDVEEGEGEGGV